MISTKKSRFPKKEETTDNFPVDFYYKTFALLAYAYKSGPEQTYKLPKPNNIGEIKEDKSHPFQSRIVDLRLRRIQNTRNKIQVESNQKILDSYDQIEELINEYKDNDIESIFQPEKVALSDVPLYLQNIQNDEKNDHLKNQRKKRANPIDLKTIEKQYTERLKRSEQIGKQRAKDRFLMYQDYEKQSDIDDVDE